MSSFKQIIRKCLLKVPFNISKNIEYDKLTLAIMDKVLKADAVCIDVGCHKGEVLEEMIKRAPKGRFFAFEPIPEFYAFLKQNFTDENCKLFNCALGVKEGTSDFNYVKSNPAYSGLKKREYKSQNEEIEKLTVEVKRLDDLIPSTIKIDFIKIDVEGGELDVLGGAVQLIKRDKPIVVFEFGLGASDYYGTKPVDIYNLLCKECGLFIYTLKDWKTNGSYLDQKEFEDQYFNRINYYFIAAPI